MKNDSKTPHMGMIVALGVLIAAIWMLAIYDTIQDAHEEKYDVMVRPGAVSYGTHSSATVPMVSAPTRHTAAPMISGSAVRSYAHYGHAAYTVHHTPYTVHTTSSATVHTIGSGDGASGGLSSSPSGDRGASSSRGIAYGGASVSMPTFALVTPIYSSSAEAEAPARFGMGPRRAPGYTGSVGDKETDGDGEWYWDPDDEEWIQVGPGTGIGTLWYDGSDKKRWNGAEWEIVGHVTEPTPLGDTPWHWMLLLALGYGIAKMRLRKRIHG